MADQTFCLMIERLALEAPRLRCFGPEQSKAPPRPRLSGAAALRPSSFNDQSHGYGDSQARR